MPEEPIDPAVQPVIDPPAPPAAPAPTAQEIATATAQAVTSSLAEVFGGRRTEAAAPRPLTIEQQMANLTPEQKQALETAIANNPLAGSMEIAKLMAKEQMAEFAEQARPYITLQGNQFIQGFISQQTSDPLFAQVKPLFQKAVANFNASSLANRAPAEVERDLQIQWDACAASVYRNVAVGARPLGQPPSMSGGGAVGALPVVPATRGVIDQDPGLAALVEQFKRKGLFNEDDKKYVEDTYQDVFIG
jgi:hypothetical protein